LKKPDPLQPHLKKTFNALVRARDAVSDLAAESLAVKPALCGKLGAVGKKLAEAYDEYNKLVDEYHLGR
jgi:hypothetical protein